MLFVFMPDNIYAKTQMECSYQGIFRGIGYDGAGLEYTVDIVIKLENNSFSLVSATWTNGLMPGVDSCDAGGDVLECINTYGQGSDFYFDYVKAIKKSGSYYTVITDNKEYTDYFVKDDKYACPQNVTVLKHEKEGNNTFAMFVSNEAFNNNYCDHNEISDYYCGYLEGSGYDTFTLKKTISTSDYDGGTLNAAPSSGNCCVYRFNNGQEAVYTYLLNSNTGATSYATCYGTNCMTNEPNMSNFAQYMSPSEDSRWSSYHMMSNCNNMPSHIWYTTINGRKKFYPYDPTGTVGAAVYSAVLQPNEYCESNVYSSDGISPVPGDLDVPVDFGDEVEGDCQGLLGEDLLNDISDVFTYIRIAVPILVIVLGSVDFAKIILTDDQQEMKKAWGRFAKRCVIAVAIFFVPTIIMYLLSFIDKIADVSCDIRLW